MKISLFIKILVLSVASFAMASSAFAQKTISTNVKIYKFSSESSFGTTVRKKADVDTRFWFKSNDKWLSFSSDGGNNTSFSYNGPSSMVLYKKIAEGNDDKSFAPITTINLPSGSKDVFVIMISSGASASFYPINVSPDKLPKGKIVIANMTRRVLGLQFGNGTKAKPLRPNGNAIFSEPKKKNSSGAVPVAIAARVNGVWEISYKSRVHYPRDQRCIMLVYDTSKGALPQLSVNIVQF